MGVLAPMAEDSEEDVQAEELQEEVVLVAGSVD